MTINGPRQEVWVDIPTSPNSWEDGDSSPRWANAAKFRSSSDAYAWLLKEYGIEEEDAEVFLSYGDAE